ncbi:ABC transporter permease [Candidatus Laterigemmans baculatus]|uniref:ABC transporter permease n=1 Tax=Candidatus Laterigemmans baculatus TaxID=2770505 RepID=UPI0013D988CE|nr:ABC transporter permease [Candidatus Laterigemmans baculatus]
MHPFSDTSDQVGGPRLAVASSAMPEIVYSPDSPLTHPWRLIRQVVADLLRCRELIWVLFLRDLKAQFRQSLLGYVWLFMPPIVTTLVWLFLHSQRVVSISDPGIPYPVFVIIGSIVWQTFVKLLQSPVAAFNAGKPVFMKLKVPVEAFIAAGTARAIFEFFIYAIVLVPVFVIYQVVPPWTIALTPVVILAIFAIGTALGVLLVPFGSLYTDVQQAIPVLMAFLMYMAPVVYPPPEHGIAGLLIRYNPMTPILMGSRDLLTTGSLEHLPAILIVIPISLSVGFVSLVVVRIVMPHLVARMGM